ncbi:DnaT-like ssDNA-binding domain-containing protein [Morganella morganii]
MATFKWLRLWHDMPNDPKWRTISRISKQPISLVQAVYIHLLVDASQNVTTCHDVSQRGHVTVTTEDLASALDVENEQISAVLNAMQGRVLEGSKITGWERRQPKKEDVGNEETGAKSAAQRKREQRERERKQREEQEANEQCHDGVTTCHEMSRPDKIREYKDLKNNSLSDARAENFIPDPDAEDPPAGNWSDYPGKFAMTGHWQPDQDFSRKAAQWGVILNEPYRPEELAEFITYWQAEGKAKHHAQWEMAFAKSIQQQRMKTNGGNNGTNKHNQTGSPFAGKSRAMQKFLQSVHDNHGPEAVAALVENDRAVRGQMDQEEQRGAVIDVEASNRRIE